MDKSDHSKSRRRVLTGAGIGAVAQLVGTSAEAALASVAGMALPRATADIVPFKLAVPQRELDDLKRRLAATRWPERETVVDGNQGVPLDRLKSLVSYWHERYDWRRCERMLNAFGQYRTEIDGLGIHFLHVRSRHQHALPLLLTHGWPGSVIEFHKVIGPLTDPTRFGGKAEDAFHLVIPSMPGHGFSDKPTSTGWGLPRIASAWAVLMRRLGYRKYVAQGGDWGAGVTVQLAKQRPAELAAIHLNFTLMPPLVEGTPNAAELKAIEQLTYFDANLSGYAKIHATRPQTVGYGLTDSPVGQAAWIYEKFLEWTATRPHPELVLSQDDMLDDIMLYWLPGAAASSARLYREAFASQFEMTRLELPVAVSVFPGELYQPPRSWVEKIYPNLVYWNEAEKGGHFAAFEQPEVFTRELRSSMRDFRI